MGLVTAGTPLRTGHGRRSRLATARLYLVVEAEIRGRSAAGVVAAALDGGVDAVQLREKSLPDEAVVAAGRELRELCDRHGALLVVNDRPDLALACGADGVHVGQADVPPDEVRRHVGDDLVIGISTHSEEEVDAALDSAADYFAVGPVFPTATKPEAEPVGLGLVRFAGARAAKPFFAIGGIDGGNAAAVAEAGADRVAVVRAIRDASNPRAAAIELRAAVERGASGREAPVGTPG
jgi:thiamine-phosphate pyrophosphorylase